MHHYHLIALSRICTYVDSSTTKPEGYFIISIVGEKDNLIHDMTSRAEETKNPCKRAQDIWEPGMAGPHADPGISAEGSAAWEPRCWSASRSKV